MDEPKKQNLSEILGALAHVDDDLPPENFDPGALVGDLRGKVDAIKWRLDTWDAEADKIQGWIDVLETRREALRAKAQRLEAYVKNEMVKNQFETLPGTMMKLKLQNNAPSVQVDSEANAQQALKFPKYITVKTSYSWNKMALKNALDAKVEDIPKFVSLHIGKQIRFYAK